MTSAPDRRAAPSAPLLGDAHGATALFHDAGAAITPARFLAEVARVAAALPDGPYVANLCGDRYRFAVGLCAALVRGQTTLLPMNPLPATLADLARRYAGLYVLADEPIEAQTLAVKRYPDEPAPAGGATAARVDIPGDRPAVVLFTSGSTGEPVAHPRRWGALVASTDAAARMLGIAGLRGAAVLGTVPHHHSYGLESVTLLALRHGLCCDRARPLLPADVLARLAALPAPRILVTTPVHLRSLVDDGGPWPPLARIVSATAPLDPALAARAEACFAAPLYEIYGCTEVGQIALRRTVETEEWSCLEGIELTAAEGEVWASGPAAAARAALNDIIELRDAGRFVLHGRKSDLVNVAGKRSSLAYLNHQLNAVPGVRDGVFVAPTSSGEVRRLAAYAVAPGLLAADILAALGRVLDPAFLPRPLHLVAELPRNALGKLPQRAIAALAPQAEGWSSVELRFPPDHPTAPGHFPGQPIVPGALLVDRVLRALDVAASPARPRELRYVKFLHPVRPGDALTLRWRPGKDGDVVFEMHLADRDGPAVSGAVKASGG